LLEGQHYKVQADLEILGDVSLQMLHGHTKAGVLLDLLLINKEKLLGFVSQEQI